MSDRVGRFTLGSLVAILLLLPFAILIVRFNSWRLVWTPELVEALSFTIYQAFLSAVASLIFGVLGGLGLLWVGRVGGRKAKIAEGLALLPNIAPVLLMILAAMKAFPQVRGVDGIILVHTLLNVGLVSSAFARLVRDKVGGMAELAWVEGASGPRFFFKGALPYLKNDVLTIGLFVFALCFTSFAVPLAIGGSRATTLEVLIYQKIRVAGDWGQALGVATLQLMAILVLSWVLRREGGTALAARPVQTPLVSWRFGLLFAVAPALLLLWGFADGFVSGARQLAGMSVLLSDLPGLLGGSIVVGLGTGLLSALLLLVIAYVNPSGLYRRLMIGYVAPSTVLMGFALLIAWRATGFATYFKIVCGLTLITVPSFYRLQWDNALSALAGQRTIAWVMGASDFLVFRSIVLPQVVKPCAFIAGVASLWAWGDFALSAVVAEKDVTLAMLAQGLIESYRLDAATVLIWFISLGGIVSFALFTGVGRVFDPQSRS